MGSQIYVRSTHVFVFLRKQRHAYCEHKFVVNGWDPITCLVVLCNGSVFLEGLMMIPRESKHVAQGQ